MNFTNKDTKAADFENSPKADQEPPG
jgi:hypothetical protein